MQRQALWKLRREAGRAIARPLDWLARPVRRLRTILHDRRRATLVSVHEGQLTGSGKVAIYVIYQPDGVKPSTYLTCDWLSGSGYAPLVVSNAPVGGSDLAKLQAHSWLVAERPNVGYDFGACRDGLWIMRSRQKDPLRLLLINDSVWVPLADDSRMLDEIERETAGMGGAVFVARSDRSRHNAHFQSFLVGFSRAVLQHPAFDRFWQHLSLSDNRRIVLAEGEKGLSQAILSAGFAGNSVHSGQLLMQRLNSADVETLKLALSHAAYDDPAQQEAGDALLATAQPSDAWRHAALTHCARVLQRLPPMNAFPVASILLLGSNFLKKGNNLPIYAAMRWQYLRAVDNGVLPAPAPEILAEIRASKLDRRSNIDTTPEPPA